MIHIIPVADKIDHRIATDCPCQPLIAEEAGSNFCIHHAWDLREKDERQGRVDPEKKWKVVSSLLTREG